MINSLIQTVLARGGQYRLTGSNKLYTITCRAPAGDIYAATCKTYIKKQKTIANRRRGPKCTTSEATYVARGAHMKNKQFTVSTAAKQLLLLEHVITGRHSSCGWMWLLGRHQQAAAGCCNQLLTQLTAAGCWLLLARGTAHKTEPAPRSAATSMH